MRVTWLTDLHLNFLDEEQVLAFFRAVEREQPDTILVTGDTGESGDIVAFIEGMSRIAPLYFVLGNHDFYGSAIADVRRKVRATGRWLPGIGPTRLTDATILIGVDGWGDARCGDLNSRLVLSDWYWIRDLQGLSPRQRVEVLRAMGSHEAHTLKAQLADIEPSKELLVLTHVPPFAAACWYEGRQSEPAWLPWFTCIAVGDTLLEYARNNPRTQVTVLCGHSHGRGTYRAFPNLCVLTGGWHPGEQDYGNPVIQASWSIA